MKSLADVFRLLLLTAVYYAGARIGLYLEAQYGGITPIWIPSGIAVAIFLTKGLKYWPMIIMGEMCIALTLGQSYLVGCIGALAQTLEALMAFRLLTLKNVREITVSARAVLWFALLGALVPPVLAAAVGSSTLWLLGYLESSRYASGLITWWLGDASGILVLAPIITGLGKRPCLQPRAWVHFSLYTALFVAVCLAIIILGDQRSYYLFFILIPFVVVAAIHFRLVGAGCTTLILAILVFGMRLQDLEGGDFITAVRMAFVGTCAFTGYLVTGFMEKRQARLTLIRQQSDYLKTLHDISLHLVGQLRIDHLMRTLVERACRLVNTQHGYFCIGNGEADGTGDGGIEVKAGKGLYADIGGYRINTGDGVAGKVWQTGEPMCVNDYRLWEGRHPDSLWDEVSAIIGVPVRGKAQVAGVIGVMETGGERRFTEDDVNIMDRFAALASIALQNARVHTELKRAEARQRQLLAAIEFTVEEIMITDLDGTIQYVNPAFEKTTGYAKREAVGRKPSILKSGRHDEAFYAELWDTLLRGKLWNGRFYNKAKDGTAIIQRANIAPIRDEAGQSVGFVSVKRDITEHERLKEQLIRAQKMEAIGTLTGGIAHDFNNILAGIIGYTELALTHDEMDNHPVERYLREVLSASHRATDLVRQILTIGRSQSEAEGVVDVKQIAEEVMMLIKASLPPSIKLELRLSAANTQVWAAATNIHQVLLNLVTNAVQALKEERGGICIAVSNRRIATRPPSSPHLLTPGAYLEIAVSDSGCGMAAETMSQIFDPYFTTKASGEGTGLGLSVLHGIVKHLGGTVTVDSEIGSGSTFRVLLPVHADAETIAPETASDLPQGAETILFVDDEPFLREIGEERLRHLGYGVAAFCDSPAALAAFRSDPKGFDLIFTDMHMPHLNGIEVSHAVRALRPDIPIVVCSGNPSKIKAEEIAKLGGCRICAKPLSLHDMARLLRDMLDD